MQAPTQTFALPSIPTTINMPPLPTGATVPQLPIPAPAPAPAPAPVGLGAAPAPGPLPTPAPLAPVLNMPVVAGAKAMSSNPTVSYKDFQANRVHPLSVEPKKSAHKDPKLQVNYMSMPLMYNYGEAGKDMMKDMLVELPECYSTGGVFEKEGENNRVSYSILAKWSLQRSETKEYLAIHKAMFLAIAQAVALQKGQLKLVDFNPNQPGAAFKDPMRYSRDKVTNEIIPGSDPRMYFKVKPWKVTWIGLDGKPIPWRVLQNVDMTFIPLVHFESIYTGGNGQVSLQIQLYSSVVTSTKPRGGDNLQSDTVKKYTEANPAAVDLLSQQIADLTLKNQDRIEADAKKAAERKAAKAAESKKELPPPTAAPAVPPAGNYAPPQPNYQSQYAGPYQPQYPNYPQQTAPGQFQPILANQGYAAPGPDLNQFLNQPPATNGSNPQNQFGFAPAPQAPNAPVALR